MNTGDACTIHYGRDHCAGTIEAIDGERVSVLPVGASVPRWVPRDRVKVTPKASRSKRQPRDNHTNRRRA